MNPVKSTKFGFVERHQETQAFRNLLDDPTHQVRIMYLQAQGGAGKTQLLHHFRDICLNAPLPVPCTELIDFYDMPNRQVNGLMQRLAAELTTLVREEDPSAHWCFADFDQVTWGFQDSFATETLARMEREAEENFIKDYNRVANWFARESRPLVLFFDTYEVVQERGRVSDWLFKSFLPLVENTVLAFAGRKPLNQETAIREHGVKLDVFQVQHFNLEEARDYLNNRNIGDLDDVAIQRIHKLTKDGNPLLIALVADWIQRHIGQDPALLYGELPSPEASITEDIQQAFEQKLISSILSFDIPDEYNVVRMMAHVYQRFNAEILAWINHPHTENNPLSLDKLNREELRTARNVLNNVSNFEFVKERQSESGVNYQLHDEMRRLVTQHIWDAVDDPQGSLRCEYSEKMERYYEQAIKRVREREARVMRAEQLYHRLYLDLARGYDEFDRRFQEADLNNDNVLCGLLLSSTEDFRDELPDDQQMMIRVYEGWLYKNQGLYEDAERILKSVLPQLEALQHERLDEIYNSLGYIYRLLGLYTEAQHYYELALEKAYQSDKTPDERTSMIAMILNNQGNIYRLQGNVDKAHEKCMVGLMLRRKLERASETPSDTVVRGIARSCYVLGLILREFGDNSGALRYFQEAEERYRQLDDQHGVANVLRWRAYIFSHVENYNYAIALAEESLQKLEQGVKSADLADTQDILGRIYRDSAMHDFRLAVEQDQVDQEAIDRRNRDLALAEQFIRMGYDTATAVGDKYKEAESILSYVRLHYEREEYAEALKRYNEGMAICRKHEYNLLMSYYEFYAGRTHYMMARASQEDAEKIEHYRQSFRHFAWRAAYASRCRAMELGMTLDSIGTHLTRLEDSKLIVHFADYLLNLWEGEQSELRAYRLRERYTPLVELCEEIKRLFL